MKFYFTCGECYGKACRLLSTIVPLTIATRKKTFLSLYNHSVFLNISNNLQENRQRNYIPGIFWAFKSKLQIILAATHIALFLPDTNNCFLYVQYHISISVSTIFSFCVFIFTFSFFLFSPRNTFYNLHCFI